MNKIKYRKVTILFVFFILLFYFIIGIHKKYMQEIAPSMNDSIKNSLYTEDIERTKNKKNKEIVFQNKRFDCTAMFGFESVIYRDLTFPVQISVTNKGKSVDGTICVSIPEKDGTRGISIVKEIQIGKRETKKFYMDIPRITTINQCKIMILEDDTVLLEKDVKGEFQYDDQGSAFLGVLSKKEQAFNYLDQIVLSMEYDSILRKVALSETSFPEELEIIKHFQYILLDELQNIRLSKKQKNNLIQWIEQGGIVLCYSKQDYDTLRTMLKQEKIKENESINIQLEHSKLIVKNFEYELGSILILPSEIGKKDMKLHEKREFAELLFYNVSNHKLQIINKGNRFAGVGYIMERALDFHYDIHLPKTRVYFSILLLYIICVAPIGYFVLKRIDKREWIGFWIVGFAVVFHAIILIISNNSILKEPVGTMIAIVDGSKKKWDETLYTSWINPTRYPYSIRFLSDYHCVYPYYNEYYNIDQKARLEKTRYFMKKNENGTQIVFGDANILEREFFIAERQVDKNQIAFSNQLHITQDGITGKVTNNTGTDLWDSGIFYNGWYIWLGEWRNGETKTITLEQNYLIEQDKDLSQSDLGEVFTKFIPEDKKKDIQMLRRTEDLYYFFKSKCMELKFDEGFIFGLSNEYNNENKIETSVKKKGKTLYYTKFSDLMEGELGYIIPNIMSMRVKNIESSAFDLSNNIYYGQDDIVTFQFNPNFELIELYSSYSTKEKKDTQELSIYIWDYTKQKYEEIFTIDKEIEKAKLKRYIKDNQIKIRFISNGRGVELPKISAVGGEKNVGDKTTH